jgi:hypothetical protein
MKAKRVIGSLVAAGTLTAAAFGFAPAAQASASITEPTLASNTIGSAINYAISAQTSGGLDYLSSFTVNVAGPDPFTKTDTFSSGGTSTDTITWPVATAKHNGTYYLCSSGMSGAGASACGSLTTNVVDETLSIPGQPQYAAAQTFEVNVPPVAVSGVKAALNPAANNTPLVTWNANPEPDITGYEVFRSGSGSTAASFTTQANVTSYQDTTAPQGVAVSYIVVAVRSSPVWTSGITSCGGQAPCSTPPTSAETSAVTVPAPTAAATVPQNVATADPPKPVKAPSGSAGSSSSAGTSQAPIALGKPLAITAPSLPTTVIQQPEPNVVQFAPLLPYSGKIPEVAVSSNVPPPVQAQNAPVQQGASVSLPGVGKVKTVDAVKYIAAAAFLLLVAVHLTRYARRLTAASS